MRTNIAILGSSGMLGSMVLDYLSTHKDLHIVAPSRAYLPMFNFEGYHYVINCIGIIKQKLGDTEEAIRVNSLLPYMIRKKSPHATIIQIATDCVFLGYKGYYAEDESHNASDIYGKTKSLGEVNDPKFYNIRCSIIGLDKDKVSLLSWFLSQRNVQGYTNYHWNGITNLHFAKLCYAIIKKKRKLPNVIHFIPADSVSKFELLTLIKEKFNKHTAIKPYAYKMGGINRILSTHNPQLNTNLWKDMGYKTVPTIEQMVEELAAYISL